MIESIEQIQKDAELINSLGGPTKVAKMLGYPLEHGRMRVWNWTVRGIPPRVKLTYPKIFLKKRRQ